MTKQSVGPRFLSRQKSVQPDQKPSRLALTMREAAEELRMCERSVWQAIKDGHLKAAKLGRSVRIRREELERFLREAEG